MHFNEKKNVSFYQISTAKEDLRNNTALYNPFTIKQLQESFPYLNWLDYIRSMMPTGVEITEDEIIINWEPKFFQQLGDILNSTPKRTIANYLLWRAILTISEMLPDNFRDLGMLLRTYGKK